MWQWICNEQKSSVTHIIVTWVVKYNRGYSCTARACLSHEVCEHSSLPVRAHVNSLFLLWKGLCFTGNPNYCFFLFYSGAVAQSLLNHLPDLWIMKHLREIPLSSDKQPKGSLEMYPETHSQLALENLAEGLVIMGFFQIFPLFPGSFEPKMLRVLELILPKFNHPRRWEFTTQNLTQCWLHPHFTLQKTQEKET